MKQILVVEDDEIIASGLVYALKEEGYSVLHNKNVKEVEHTIQKHKFHLAILDMQLPDGTGFDVCAKLAGTETAVIFLTVVDDEGNIVRAFESGADDYITKPFRLSELLVRVKRTLNKQNEYSPAAIMSLGNIKIDMTAGRVYSDEKVYELTALEYRLLLTFALHKGQMLTRTQILENIWDSAGNFVEDNTLTVYIKRLREKLGNAVTIETIRGRGYRVD